MPELPEVETYARALAPLLEGVTLTGARVIWPKVAAWPPAIQADGQMSALNASSFADAVPGRTIRRVWRRAKYLVFDLDDGALLIHLRMTGKLVIHEAIRSGEAGESTKASQGAKAGENDKTGKGGKGGKGDKAGGVGKAGGIGTEAEPHLTLALGLADGRELCFIDYRKFGRAWVVDHPDEVVGELGPEPLSASFTASRFACLLKGRRGRLKPLLLDQRFIAGLGNIYVDEALFGARLHPLATADTLDRAQVKALHRSIRSVLREAIDRGGTTFQSFVGPEGEVGRYRNRLRVFGRTDEDCQRRDCKGTIRRIVVGQRSTHFCPVCQPAPA